MLGTIILIATIAANWRIYTKMGRKGWESIVPVYNIYVLFDMLYGKGWRFLLLLIPIYNIYVAVKTNIDLAHNFNKSTGFGVGLTLLNTVFILILGFGSSVYLDGSMDCTAQDEVSNAVSNVTSAVKHTVTDAKDTLSKDPKAIEKITELAKLRDLGTITEEEFEKKKAELLKKI